MISMNPLDVGLGKRDEKENEVARVLYSKQVKPGFYKYKFTKDAIELTLASKSDVNAIEVKPKKGVNEFYVMYASGEFKVMPVKESYVEYE